VQYSSIYEQEQSRIYAGMSVAEYDALPGTPDWAVDGQRTKAHILVLYRMSNAIPAAISDAQARESERKSKLKPRGH
jgi:hypothetical protein